MGDEIKRILVKAASEGLEKEAKQNQLVKEKKEKEFLKLKDKMEIRAQNLLKMLRTDKPIKCAENTLKSNPEATSALIYSASYNPRGAEPNTISFKICKAYIEKESNAGTSSDLKDSIQNWSDRGFRFYTATNSKMSEIGLVALGGLTETERTIYLYVDFTKAMKR